LHRKAVVILRKNRFGLQKEDIFSLESRWGFSTAIWPPG